MLNINTDDFEVDYKPTNNSEQAFIYLKNLGYIAPGKIIPGDKVENALGVKNEPTWKFLGPYLELRGRIEEESFFTSSRGLEAPSFRILPTEEMPEQALKNMKKATARVAKTAEIMNGHDHSKLDDVKQKVWHFQERKAAEISLFNQKVLYKRNFV